MQGWQGGMQEAQELTLSVGAWEGGLTGGAGRARGALPPLISNTRGALRSRRPWRPSDTVPLGTLGSAREHPWSKAPGDAAPTMPPSTPMPWGTHRQPRVALGPWRPWQPGDTGTIEWGAAWLTLLALGTCLPLVTLQNGKVLG